MGKDENSVLMNSVPMGQGEHQTEYVSNALAFFSPNFVRNYSTPPL